MPPSLQCPDFSRTLQSRSPVAARHWNSYGKWRGAEGGDNGPAEGQADLTPLPAAKCSVGSVVITQNRAIVCASCKRQSLLETCRGIAGAAIYSAGSHLGSCWHRTPLYLAPFPLPHQSSCLLMLAISLGTWRRAWPSKECRQALGRKEERSCINLGMQARKPPQTAVI